MKLGIRVWVLVAVLFLSLLAIAPWESLEKGVIIKSVELNSTALNQGLKTGQIISAIDGKNVESFDDFSRIMSEKNYSTERIKTIFSTNQGEFIIFSNKTPEITVSDIPNSNIKTGLDLSGGSRALVEAQGKELSLLEVNDLIDVVGNRLNVY